MVLTMSMGITAFAGQWQSDANGWWYQNDDSSYPSNTWQWIDGNGDGVAESFYFNEQGYCLMNTTTPDGHAVNPTGAWIVDGVVQTQQLAAPPVNSNVQAKNLWDMEPVAESAFTRDETWRTNQNALWSNVLRLSGSVNYTHAEYYTAKEYNRLTAQIAPAQEFSDSVMYTLEVYGDDDVLLESYEIDYKSTPMEISVDVSRREYINLVWARTEGSWSGGVLLKDAGFN